MSTLNAGHCVQRDGMKVTVKYINSKGTFEGHIIEEGDETPVFISGAFSLVDNLVTKFTIDRKAKKTLPAIVAEIMEVDFDLTVNEEDKD